MNCICWSRVLDSTKLPNLYLNQQLDILTMIKEKEQILALKGRGTHIFLNTENSSSFFCTIKMRSLPFYNEPLFQDATLRTECACLWSSGAQFSIRGSRCWIIIYDDIPSEHREGLQIFSFKSKACFKLPKSHRQRVTSGTEIGNVKVMKVLLKRDERRNTVFSHFYSTIPHSNHLCFISPRF